MSENNAEVTAVTSDNTAEYKYQGEIIQMPGGWTKISTDIYCEDKELTLKNEFIPEPYGYKVYIKTDPIRRKTKSGIILADESISAEDYYQSTGVIIAKGSTAYCNKQTGEKFAGNWPEIGDRVIFGRYAGKKVHINGVALLLVNDDDVSSGVPYGALVKSYVNEHVASNNI